MISVPSLLIAALATTPSGPREEREFTETYTIASGTDRTLTVDNIWGNIRVTGHDSNQLEVHVREVRSAPDAERMELSRELLSLIIVESDAGIAFSLPHRYRNGYKDPDRDALWHQCQECRLALDYEIRMPRDMAASLSTVNDGQIALQQINGRIHARNINGDVTLDAIAHCDEVETVNGDVRVGFSGAPQDDCQIQTINGDITVGLPPRANLDLGLQIGNGRIRSEHDVTQINLPADRSERQSDRGTQYRLRLWTGLRLGQGGPLHTIESLNGDVDLIEL